MKKIIKAFEKWRYEIVYTDKERIFSKRYSGHEAISAKGYYAGYKAGQKAEREKTGLRELFHIAVDLPTFSDEAFNRPKDPTEWLPLEIDNLPDILTGGYEVQGFKKGEWIGQYGLVIKDLETWDYRYRPIQKEPAPEEKAKIIVEYMGPTHEEIMTLWWNMPTGKQYWQVESYNLDRGYWIGSAWQNKNWFIGRESYIIPPEK